MCIFEYKFLEKRNILCGTYKKTKKCYMNNHVGVSKFVFLHRTKKFSKKLRANIECPGIHVHTSFDLFIF
jgi:hypothetical protein